MYNPSGRFEASNYRFPYESESFGVAFATSVFTHLMRADLDNYVKEAARMLAPGGRLLATFFLLNDGSLKRMRAGKAGTDFSHLRDGCNVSDPGLPPQYRSPIARRRCAISTRSTA